MDKDMYVDLGAEQLLTAEREERKIAVEIKSFVGTSEIEDLKYAVGQFVLYRAIMRQTDPDRTLYLAVRKITFNSLFEEPVGQLLIADQNLSLIVFEAQNEVIDQWIT
ncbi:MAG: fatty-acid synthase [Symploca sp. SIO2D2]|nr:fatty-acid synthase [Symploca sp. SIO2D2]